MEKIIRFLTLVSLSVSPVNAFSDELRSIESQIEALGTPVKWAMDHPLCRQGLFGAYVPKDDVVFICQGNHDKGDYQELLGTLKHEGWHVVQRKCNNGRAALRDEQIRPHLKPRDRRSLHGYHPRQTRAEAEARVVEQIPTTGWLNGVRAYCAALLKSSNGRNLH